MECNVRAMAGSAGGDVFIEGSACGPDCVTSPSESVPGSVSGSLLHMQEDRH